MTVQLTRQQSYYVDLCNKRRVKPKDFTKMTYEEINQEIQMLRDMPPVATQAQLNKITEILTKLHESNPEKYKLPSTEFLASLTMDKASKLIQSLIKIEREVSLNEPPTQEQIDSITRMYLCPSVPFEDIGVPSRIVLETNEDGSVKHWRRPTVQEIKELIAKNLTRQSAYEFIQKYGNEYYQWKQTRIKDWQIERIRNLEQRMANIYTDKRVEFAFDENGELIEMETKERDKSRRWNPQAYEPLDEYQIRMLSFEDAQELIERLQFELSDRSLTRGLIYEDDLNSQVESVRSKESRTLAQEIEEKFTEFQNTIFKIEEKAGYRDEAIHDACQELLIYGFNNENVMKKVKLLRDWLMYLIDEDFVTLPQMSLLVSNSKIWTDILMGRYQ